MTTKEIAAKTEKARKIGRPRKFPPGRISVYLRVTPERLAILKGTAEHHGRSLSEQIEYELEWAAAERAVRAATQVDKKVRGISEQQARKIVNDTAERMLEDMRMLFAELKR
jgi:hypothetical protein